MDKFTEVGGADLLFYSILLLESKVLRLRGEEGGGDLGEHCCIKTFASLGDLHFT